MTTRRYLVKIQHLGETYFWKTYTQQLYDIFDFEKSIGIFCYTKGYCFDPPRGFYRPIQVKIDNIEKDCLIDNHCRLYDWNNNYYGIYSPKSDFFIPKEFMQDYSGLWIMSFLIMINYCVLTISSYSCSTNRLAS